MFVQQISTWFNKFLQNSTVFYKITFFSPTFFANIFRHVFYVYSILYTAHCIHEVFLGSVLLYEKKLKKVTVKKNFYEKIFLLLYNILYT